MSLQPWLLVMRNMEKVRNGFQHVPVCVHTLSCKGTHYFWMKCFLEFYPRLSCVD